MGLSLDLKKETRDFTPIWYTPIKVLYSSSVAWSFRQLPDDLKRVLLAPNTVVLLSYSIY